VAAAAVEGTPMGSISQPRQAATPGEQGMPQLPKAPGVAAPRVLGMSPVTPAVAAQEQQPMLLETDKARPTETTMPVKVAPATPIEAPEQASRRTEPTAPTQMSCQEEVATQEAAQSELTTAGALLQPAV